MISNGLIWKDSCGLACIRSQSPQPQRLIPWSARKVSFSPSAFPHPLLIISIRVTFHSKESSEAGWQSFTFSTSSLERTVFINTCVVPISLPHHPLFFFFFLANLLSFIWTGPSLLHTFASILDGILCWAGYLRSSVRPSKFLWRIWDGSLFYLFLSWLWEPTQVYAINFA